MIAEGQAPTQQVSQLQLAQSQHMQAAFDEEIKSWISSGILIPWSAPDHGEVKNVVPVMSVHQVKGEKHKV